MVDSVSENQINVQLTRHIKHISEDMNKEKINDNVVLLRLNSTAIYEAKEVVDHFQQVSKNLNAMGFSSRIINNCFRLHRILNLHEAIDLLIKDKGKYLHRFIEKEGQEICDLCEERIENHAEYIDQAKIVRSQTILKNIGSMLTLDRGKRSSYIADTDIKKLKSIHLKTCEICMDDYDDTQIELKYKLECGHPYCPTCLEMHLETEITNGRVKKIVCPYKNCNFEIVTAHIEMLVESKPGLKEKYVKFRKIKELEDDPNNVFCPFPNCEGYITYENRKLRVATMLKCQSGHEICTRCEELWHQEKKCEMQFEEEIERLVLDHKMRLKKCPGCSNWTEKNLGCNHMTCVFCKFQWCWLCNMKYFYNHYTAVGTKCYGKQFPQGDQYDWEDHDPKIFEEAKLHANDPNPIPHTVLNVAQPRIVVVPIPPMTTHEYFKSLSPVSLLSVEVDGCLMVIHHFIYDFITFLFMSILNFFGNFTINFYLWKNSDFMDQDFFSRRGCLKFYYYMTICILWLIYFVTCLGTATIVFGVNITYSLVFNGYLLYRNTRVAI